MTLLENSISFFIESISKAVEAEKSPEQWKFAILLLVQAIETCLKERLRWTQDILIYLQRIPVSVGLPVKMNYDEICISCLVTAYLKKNVVRTKDFTRLKY